ARERLADRLAGLDGAAREAPGEPRTVPEPGHRGRGKKRENGGSRALHSERGPFTVARPSFSVSACAHGDWHEREQPRRASGRAYAAEPQTNPRPRHGARRGEPLSDGPASSIPPGG